MNIQTQNLVNYVYRVLLLSAQRLIENQQIGWS